MTTFLMCDPSYYGVVYSINPWMSLQNQPDRGLAIKQWQNLLRIIEEIGCRVEVMSGKPNLPDLVFTANAGLMFPVGVLLSRFKHPERQPEREVYKEWFEKMGYNVLEHIEESSFFEGAGDAFFKNVVNDEKFGNDLYMGSGFRSDYFPRLDPAIWMKTIRHIELKDPRFYHLDTCFCPLKDEFALAYPDAFDNHPIDLEYLVVPEEEAVKFACNAVCINNDVIIPSGCPKTVKMLKSAAFTVHETDMSEFIKAGGACRCLTLRLD